MTDKPKPWGYIDCAALVRVIVANRGMIKLARVLIAEGQGMSALRHAQVLQRLGVQLAEQRDALAAMERIRRERK